MYAWNQAAEAGDAKKGQILLFERGREGTEKVRARAEINVGRGGKQGWLLFIKRASD